MPKARGWPGFRNDGAVHPGHAGHGLRAAGRPTIAGWPSSRPAGGSRINIHGAADLETGQTRTIEVATVDAFRDTVTGNFRVIPPKDFRVMA